MVWFYHRSNNFTTYLLSELLVGAARGIMIDNKGIKEQNMDERYNSEKLMKGEKGFEAELVDGMDYTPARRKTPVYT